LKISVNKELLQKKFNLKKEFDKEFDNIANRYEQVTFGKSNGTKYIKLKEEEPIMSLISSRLGLLCGKKILDAGAGNGRWSKLFLTLGCEVYSLDKSSEMCIMLRKIPRLNVVQGDIQEVKLEEKFDVVFSMRTLKYTSLSSALANIRNLLNDKGIVIFDVPNRLNPFYFIFDYLSLYLIYFFKNNGYMKYSLTSHLYTRSAAEKIICSNHYNILERVNAFFFPDFIYRRLNNAMLLKLVTSIDSTLSKILPRHWVYVVQQS